MAMYGIAAPRTQSDVLRIAEDFAVENGMRRAPGKSVIGKKPSEIVAQSDVCWKQKKKLLKALVSLKSTATFSEECSS